MEALCGEQLDEDVPIAGVVAALQQTWHPFFLIPDLQRRARCERVWRDVLGDHVICMESPADTCYVAAGLVGLTEGVVADLDGLAKILAASGLERDRLNAVIRAVTPYAATLGKDGAPVPSHAPTAGSTAGATDGSTATSKSLWKRLFQR